MPARGQRVADRRIEVVRDLQGLVRQNMHPRRSRCVVNGRTKIDDPLRKLRADADDPASAARSDRDIPIPHADD